MPIEAGKRVLHYRLIEKIGEGGMGVVWQAEDTILHRQVALKILPEAVSSDPERLARFEREAKLLASLNHPNIATVHGLHEHEGLQFLAMELVPGEDLAQRIARGALPVESALDVARQIAEGLEAAHEAGMIHRDLKPANVRRTPDGRIKVLDFGLAKGMGPADTSTSTSMSPTTSSVGSLAGVILGTAAYMSPEQARGRPLDRRTDIWSFGCVLYEMLTGVRPFAGETVSDSIARILQTEPNESSLPAETPRAVRRLLRRCLVKDPRSRLRDIGDARIEIEEAASLEDERVEGPTTVAQRAGSRTAWSVAALATIIAAVALAALLLDRRAVPATGETFVSIVAPDDAVYHALAGPPAITADGRRLTFLARDAEGNDLLWIRDLSSPNARPLAGTDDAFAPFWSPTGAAIGFFAEGKLKRVDIESGLVETLADAPLPNGGTWSSNGTILFSPTWMQSLTRIPESGGTPEPLVQADDEPEGLQGWPWFLPDGESFLFALDTGSEQGEIRVGFLDGSASRPVMPSTSNAVFAAPDRILWWHDGVLRSRAFDPRSLELTGQPRSLAADVMFDVQRSIARFSASAVGTIVYQEGGRVQPNQLVWYDRQGNATGEAGPPDNHYGPRISSDETGVVVDLSNDRNLGDVWLFDLERRARSRFTSRPGDESAPIWSPDGERVAFYARINERTRLFVKPARRAGEEQLDLGVGIEDFRPTDWSQDGDFLMLTTWDTEAAPGDLRIYSFPDGSLTRLTETPCEERDGQFSPDGRRVVFASNETGQFEIYVASSDDLDRRVRISTEGGKMPMWSRDGSEIFFVDDARILSAPVEDAARLRIGIPVPLFEVRIKEHRFRQYDVTADGKRFLVNTVVGEETREPLSLVLDRGRR